MFSKLKTYQTGTTLVETLMALGLMGVVLIPAMLLTMSWFSEKMVETREKMTVGHNGSQFLNRFISELQHTRQVLPNDGVGGTPQVSDGTHLYYSFYDPIRQKVIKRGYTLETAGSKLYLQQYRYNDASGAWETESPYGSDQADSLELPNTAEFKYCITNTTTCVNNPSDASKAIAIKMEGWEFTKKGADEIQKMEMPTVTISVGTLADPSTTVRVTDKIRQIFSIDGDQSFPNLSDLQLTYLSPDDEKIANLYATAGGGGTSGLSILVSSARRPGYNSTIVAPVTGRVFFGEYGTGGSDRMWTWYSTTGLSVLLSNRDYPGYNALATAPNGNVYIGEKDFPSSIYLWKESNGLSALLPGAFWGGNSSMIAGVDGRIFFGDVFTGFWTWKDSNGLSNITSAAWAGNQAITKVNSSGWIAFGGMSLDSFYVWNPSTGLTEILSGGSQVGLTSSYLDNNGRVYFVDRGAGSTRNILYTWHSATGLTAIMSDIGVSDDGFHFRINVDRAIGRVFFGQNDTTPNFWTWDSSKGLSKLLSSETDPGYDSVVVDEANSRVFFGDSYYTGDSNAKEYWTWSTSDGLTTILSNQTRPGLGGTLVASDGRVFFGEQGNSSSFWTWKASTGLTELVSGQKQPGYCSSIIGSDGRVFFGENRDPGELLTWRSTTGLSVIISEVSKPGVGETSFVCNQSSQPYLASSMGYDADNEVLYFGQSNNSGNFWRWEFGTGSGSSNASINRALAAGGTKTNQSLNISLGTGTYSAIYQDIGGKIYLADAAGNAIERYTMNSVSGEFEKTSQLDYNTSDTPSVVAIAADQASTTIALLQGGATQQIDVYADRSINGAASATDEMNIQTLTTPNIDTATGLSINGKTGDYLLIDSEKLGGGTPYVRLFVITPCSGNPCTPTLKHEYRVYLDELSPVPSNASNLKILYNDQKNILYLVAPDDSNYIYALSLPSVLEN